MARRKDHTPAELKLLTVKTVIEFLQHRPINQLSLRSLAKMIGYSPGTLINLFKSYNHLLLDVSGYTLLEIEQRLTKATRNLESTTAQQLIEIVLVTANQYSNFAVEHPYQWQQVFDHRLDDTQGIGPAHQQRIDALFAIIEAKILKLAPNASHIEVVRASRTLWASVHGICMMSLEDKLFSPVQISNGSLIESLVTNYLNSWLTNFDMPSINQSRIR